MKYTIDEMFEMDNCDDVNCLNIGCKKCPFELQYNEKYKTWCKAVSYCLKNNIDIYYSFNASHIYIQHLKEQRLLLQDIMNL